ncbi:MAG: ABC-2 family transporter protein, partial [Clostridiales bacterium]|nr:ABC-2 family transporter protein [Clostridiales bacterium]
MKKYWDVLKIFIKNETLSKFQYRGALWADLVFYVFGYGTQFLLIFLLVGKFGDLGGWGKYEVMLLYSMSILAYTLACTFFRGPTFSTQERIRAGDFDQTLTKPMHPLLYEIISSFSAYYTVHVALSVIMVAFSLSMLAVRMTPLKILM